MQKLSYRYDANLLYINRLTYMTLIKLKLSLIKLTLDYEFRALVKLNDAFISLLAIKLVEWGVKSFS